ncbi:hypothetical protein AB0D59_34415 [Streptomyces sp. NPDC048417]|uniref:hypothetical protein n=1 Tax=Streptomyces sp. NPDC048417 TaxID=3155387 RepID=UPI00343EFE22
MEAYEQDLVAEDPATAAGRVMTESWRAVRKALERMEFLGPLRVDHCLGASAAPAVHGRLLARRQPLDGAQGVPVVSAQRKARRAYENRVNALTRSVGP